MQKMRQFTTFEMKLSAGFLATILAAIAICIIALYGLNEAVKSSHVVISDYAQDLILVGRLGTEEEDRVATDRGFLVTGDKTHLTTMVRVRKDFLKVLGTLQQSHISPQHDQFLLEIRAADDSYQQTLSKFIQAKMAGAGSKSLRSRFEEEVQPRRDRLQKAVNDFTTYTRLQLDKEGKRLSDSNKSIVRLIIAVSFIALALAAAMAITITKTLSKLYRRIQGIAKMREEIVETVAHDLRNPVAAVSLSTQTLLKMANSKSVINSDDLRRRAENIKRATDRVNSLIGGLLDLAKMKAGTLSIEKTDVSPKDILEDTFKLFDNIVLERGMILEVQQEPLPLIQCDFERIAQVFSNLIGNAIKFSVASQKIMVGAHLKGGDVVFSVADQGPGIPAEEQDKVFERYWQTGIQKRAGAGLGLAICKGIMTAHGGKIWVESKLGSGTTFYFSIPSKKTASADATARLQNRQPSA